MLNSQRVFVDAVRQYCARNNVSVELRSQGWLIIMQRGPQRQLAFGYDLGLNSAVAHRIANDKAATSEVLQASDIPCIPHTLFLNPALYEYVPPQRSWERMLRLIKDHPAGVVVKPNDGTSGKSVCKVLTESDLELAAHRIFASNQSLAISPYVEISKRSGWSCSMISPLWLTASSARRSWEMASARYWSWRLQARQPESEPASYPALSKVQAMLTSIRYRHWASGASWAGGTISIPAHNLSCWSKAPIETPASRLPERQPGPSTFASVRSTSFRSKAPGKFSKSIQGS